METVTHQGRETAYRHRPREGPTVLFVHGSGGNRSLWKAQYRLDVGVAALDLSGHGDSEDVDARPGFPTLSAYADDLLAVADAVDADVVVGNSLGGAVLLHALLDRGLDPEAVVFTGTGARLAVLDDLLDWLETDFDRAVDFLHQPGRLFHDPDEQLRETSIAAMRACGQAVTRRDFRTCHRFDVRDRLDELDVRSLAVVGSHDQLTPPWYHEYLAEELDGELTVIDGAAHLAMLERPKAFNDALREFI